MVQLKKSDARVGTKKSADRLAAEREMATGLKRIQERDPAEFARLMRLLARLSAKVARSRKEK